jgi:hypothetical protein
MVTPTKRSLQDGQSNTTHGEEMCRLLLLAESLLKNSMFECNEVELAYLSSMRAKQ